MDPSLAVPGQLQQQQQRRRQKRSQVVRACEWCRVHRTKCDNSVPCSNCKSRGARCSNDDLSRQMSLPSAHREIERLRKQVEQLEQELKEVQEGLGEHSAKTPKTPKTPLTSEPSPFSDAPRWTAPSQQPYLLADAATDTGTGIARPFWGGVHVSTARSPHKTWYGPSSLFFFIGRVAAVLDASLQFQQTDAHGSLGVQEAPSIDNMLDVNPAGMLVDGQTPSKAPSAPGPASNAPKPGLTLDPLAGARFLTLTQEEYFLDLYWQSYHTSLFAILDEAEFRQHYRSLWKSSGQARAPSALVDIVLALCMQYGVSTMAPSMRQKLTADNDDTTIAGRWYYRRCQALLEYELESPSLATLQCHVLCGVYLCNGTFQNMSDSSCGLAVREAFMLGLHLEPPPDLPLRQRELRKRIWWALYVLDSKIGMKLGRPFQVQLSGTTTPALLSDRVDVAAASGSNFAPLGDDRSWLSFHVFHSSLFRIARTAHVAFYCSNTIPVGQEQTIWDNAVALEAHAQIALAHGEAFLQWAAGVHPALTTARANDSSPFSTDGSALEIEPFAPLWVQRQRLLLELMYHNLSINLYRPMISFHRNVPLPAQQCAATCARHAITLTNLMHQVLSSTTILAGWHEAFQWQWNAAMSLVGFLLSSTQAGVQTAVQTGVQTDVQKARKAIDQAVAVFDIFGQNFAVATSAAKIIRNLCTKVDLLMQAAMQGAQATLNVQDMQNAQQPIASVTDAALPWGNGVPTSIDGADLSLGKPSLDLAFSELDPSVLQDTMMMAFDVDQWLNLNVLWPHTDGLMMSA
ncbi:hypothetical protein SEUCBS140593_005491 [Sporothrix eucalyptigena]|uniref:Zn(2)-C6 fungal-type domain-containing protein n=1 Tax=Sporothrix eucalyptigena TaxID=1812306 RepID=A0ABP0BWQ4_9PEZI